VTDLRDAEVIVVGGGPAGSTAAAALAANGRRVILLDKARFPRAKPCSDYVNAGGVQLLDEMGVLGELLCAGARRMEAMRVHAPNGRCFSADFARAEPGRAALGLTRCRLDAILLNRARAASAAVCERAHVRNVLRVNGTVTGVEATIDGRHEQIRAGLVIGADGRNSAVARSLGLSTPLRWPRKTGLVAHYRGVETAGPYGEMHVGHGLYAGLALLEDGLVNVTVVVPDRAVDRRDTPIDAWFAELIERLPVLARRLRGAERVGSISGVGSMAQRARRVAGDGYLLTGDAASFLDPFAGDGIYEALRGGQLAAQVAEQALRVGDASAEVLDAYRTARRREFAAKRAVSWIVQGFVNAPPLMNYVTDHLERRDDLGLTLSGVLGNFRPASQALSPVFLARLLRP
jgi:flavin-dependent dehydrogenase